MGQKIHPTGFRLAVSRNWASRWYANNNNFAAMLQEDIGVREYLKKKLKNASVGRVVIERPAKNARITIYSSRPGVVIGKKGEDIEQLKTELQRRCSIRRRFRSMKPSTRCCSGTGRSASPPEKAGSGRCSARKCEACFEPLTPCGLRSGPFSLPFRPAWHSDPCTIRFLCPTCKPLPRILNLSRLCSKSR